MRRLNNIEKKKVKANGLWIRSIEWDKGKYQTLKFFDLREMDWGLCEMPNPRRKRSMEIR